MRNSNEIKLLKQIFPQFKKYNNLFYKEKDKNIIKIKYQLYKIFFML